RPGRAGPFPNPSSGSILLDRLGRLEGALVAAEGVGFASDAEVETTARSPSRTDLAVVELRRQGAVGSADRSGQGHGLGHESRDTGLNLPARRAAGGVGEVTAAEVDGHAI